MGISPAVIGAIAAAVSAAGGIAGTALNASNQGGSKPSMPAMPTQDTTQLAKSMIPGAKADAAARTGGGISPDFLAGIIGQQTGEPAAGLDIIGDIRKSLGGGI